MGFDPKSLPQAFRRRMSSDVRRQIGTPTLSEIDDKQQRQAEKVAHEQFEQWLKMKGVVFCHARMDQKSTIRKGFPDFACFYGGRAALIEFKAIGGSLSADQEQVIKELKDTGTDVLVTTDVGAAIHYTKERLGIE